MKVNFFKKIYFRKQTISKNLNYIKSKFNLKAVIKRSNLNHKHFSLPAIALASSFIFLLMQEKMKENTLYCTTERNENNNFDNRLLLKNKFIILDQPQIFIIYDEENELQSEMAEMIYNNVQQNYFNIKFNFDLKNKINIRKISLKELHNDTTSILSELKLNISSDKLKNKNEPIVFIKNQIIGEYINPYSLTTEIKEKTKIKLNNLLAYKNIQSLKELREEFRFLENPNQKLILINSDDILENDDSQDFNKMISAFRDKHTKFICISDEKLRKYLKMEKGSIYTYYSNKLPNKAKDPDAALEDYFHNRENFEYMDSKLPIHEILTKEGIDLNSYMNSDPVGLMLKFNLFRDQIKISKELYKKNSKLMIDEEKSSRGKTFLTSNPEKIKFQKLISYPRRNVIKLGETDKKVIQNQWAEPNKHYLYIHIPNWVFLKENIFEYILYEASHLFDGVQIINSTNFSFKNGLYDDSQISGELPQIFIIETGENPSADRKVYSMSYFRFSDDFGKFLKNRKELFKKQEQVENLTYVQTVNSRSFEEKILKDKSFKEFMIEIKHEGCPTCYMLGKMFDHVSQKFHKHGYLNDFRFFRVDTHNDLPFLGEFAATPTYLFCRKNEKGQIEFISQVEKHEFIFKLRKLSNFDFSKVRYHPNIGFGFYLFQRQEFMKPNYDPDIDLAGFS